MKLATWNVNSIRAREARLIRWLQNHQPDALCLQELKVDTESFPFDAVRRVGYEAAVYGHADQPSVNQPRQRQLIIGVLVVAT